MTIEKKIKFPEPALLTVRQARYALGGISQPTFYKLIGERKLATVKIGRRRMVTPGAITRLIESLEQ